MARTWAVQGDSVNTSFIHLYSTVCCGDTVPNASNRNVVHQEKNMESIDTQDLKERGREDPSLGADREAEPLWF